MLRAAKRASIGAAVVTATLLPLVPLARPAAADPLSDAQAEAQQLTNQIQAEGQRLDILSQQYDTAEQRVQQLAAQATQIQGQIGLTRQRISSAKQHLRMEALAAYIDGSDTSFGIFAGSNTSGALAQEYREVATGNLSDAIDALHQMQATLDSQESQLQATEGQAQSAADQASAAEQSARATQQQEQKTLDQVKGQIATLVAQQEAAEQAAEEAAFEARVAAENAAAQVAAQAREASAQSGGASGGQVDGPAPPVETNVPVAPGGEGAVQAAESQLGVPYVWGGETPGVGFDCSGLTQWSWGQAGVYIPRTAQEQYDAIVHISLSDLEPGDLLFWNDGTSSVQHVAMYVGNDEVIQAPETGETVSYSAIWDNGLVGAGRP